MATLPMVKQLDPDLPALVALSLEEHRIPVSACFWIQIRSATDWKLAVISPFVDELGLRETYSQVFKVLDRESFVVKQFINTSLLLLGKNESQIVLDAFFEGRSIQATLGPYEDAIAYPAAKAESIQKQGFLHCSPAEGGVSIGFAPLSGAGSIKMRHVSQKNMQEMLDQLGLNESQKDEVHKSLQQKSSGPIIMTNLKVLYELGLV